jgi:hypothetical protein
MIRKRVIRDGSHERNIYAANGHLGVKPAGDPPQEDDKKVKNMTKYIIPVAGIFLACVIAAGIPAVAAADQVKTVATPVINPVPGVTPVFDHPQSPAAKITNPPVNTTPDKNVDKNVDKNADKNADKNVDNNNVDKRTDQDAENKNWWENLWPFSTVKTDQTMTTTPQVTPATTPVNSSPQKVTNPPADSITKDTPKQDVTPKVSQDTKNP